MHILLITNKLGLSHALQVALSDTDCTVSLASDAVSLDSAIAPHLPDVILLGDTCHSFFQAMLALKSNSALVTVPVILYSDNFSVHNAEYQARLGVKTALSMPLSVPQLLATIYEYGSPAHP